MPGLGEQLWSRSHKWVKEFDVVRGHYERPVLDEPMAMTCKVKTFPDGRVEGFVRWADLQRVLNASDPYVRPRGKRVESERRNGEVVERAAQRARSMVRDWCLRAHADRMATFGTRATLDFDVLLTRHRRFVEAYREALHREAVAKWEECERAAPGVLPKPSLSEFKYCAVPERHTGETYRKRGIKPLFEVSESARPHFHLHVALSGMFRLDLALPIWHALCANDFPDGVPSGSTIHGSINIKVFEARNAYEDVYSVIANYIAKYVGKELGEGVFNRKKYWASRLSAVEVNHIILNSSDWLEAQRELSARLGLDWTSLLITHDGCLFVTPDDAGIWFKCPPEMYRSVPDGM